jgi:hypothetical protein
MAVVINEFEVLDTPKQPAAAAPPAGGHKPSVSPRDIQRIIRYERHRLLRLRAH